MASTETTEPRSLALAKNGIRTAHDFTRVMSCLMTDLLEGKVSPNVGNAVTNTGGKMLKAVELQEKYGVNNGEGREKTLVLADLSNLPTALPAPE